MVNNFINKNLSFQKDFYKPHKLINHDLFSIQIIV